LLGYFRINDPYRLVIIFILLLILRLPYLISSEWLSIPELKWMLIGERMNDGAMLYVDIWDDIAPLSALVYKGINFAAGRALIAFQVLGLMVFYFQIFYINLIALRLKMYNENNYLPALFYGILGLLSFNMLTLSPVLMGMTFVLFSINNLLRHVESRNRTDANLINIGLFTGIAMLFYLPFAFAIFIHAVILLFFTNTLTRRYLLLLYGLIMPIAMTWVYYVWNGETSNFYHNYLFALFRAHPASILSLKTILILSGLTVLLYVFASFKTLSGSGFNIFQVRIQKTMFFASVVSLGIWLLYSDRAGYSLVVFVPWAAFFFAHFFLSIRSGLKRELSFLVYLLSILILYFGVAFRLPAINGHVDYADLIVQQQADQRIPYRDKKILVLGPDIQPYLHGKVSTPYFNWSLSKDQLEGLNYYDNLEAIGRNIRGDMPDYIIDQVGLVPRLFEKIPLLGREFVPVGNGIYKRSESNS
jgi:hypothetical protein